MSNKSLILHRGTVKPLNHKWPDLGATGRNRQSSRSHPTVPLKLFPLSLDTRGSLLLNQNLLCSHWSCSHRPWHLAWGSLPTVEGVACTPAPQSLPTAETASVLPASWSKAGRLGWWRLELRTRNWENWALPCLPPTNSMDLGLSPLFLEPSRESGDLRLLIHGAPDRKWGQKLSRQSQEGHV